MLTHEWSELETLCERISDLRQRYAAAQRTQNSGFIEALKADIARATRQREQLVQHISARLGSAAAEQAADPRGQMAAALGGGSLPQPPIGDLDEAAATP